MSRTPLQRLHDSVWVDENGCWLWQRAIDPNGYGRFWVAPKMGHAHRVSYELHVGPIPEGLDIDHLCRVRACCNPIHLEAVTRRTNLLRGNTLTRAHRDGVDCGHAKCPNCRRFHKEYTR